MKIVSRDELYYHILNFILSSSKAYKNGVVCKHDAEKFADEFSKWLTKKNYYIKRKEDN